MHDDERYWIASDVADDDELCLEKLRVLRPDSNPSKIDWHRIEKNAGVRLSRTARFDLRCALICLASHVRRLEFEAAEGREIDAELDAIVTGAEKLANGLRRLPPDVAEIVERTAGNPTLLAGELSRFSIAFAAIMAPKRKPGRPSMRREQHFATQIQAVWRLAAMSTKRGAWFDPQKDRVVGPAVELATALLGHADLGQCVSRVGDALRRSRPSKERAEVVDGRVVVWRTAGGETAALLVDVDQARSLEDSEGGK
jgi:hypothetical protein